MKINKFWLITLLIILIVASFVSGAVVSKFMTKQQFIETYPDDPFVKRVKECGGISNNECIESGMMEITCKIVAETESGGDEYVKFECVD
jgi:hypothetical protein